MNMIKLNTLTGLQHPTVIGELYKDGQSTGEIMVVQYGRANSLNRDRSWPDVSKASFDYDIRPIKSLSITVETVTEKTISIPVNPSSNSSGN